MWAILLCLGSNLSQRVGMSTYSKGMVCEMDVWHEVTNFLPECGINTLLIDMCDGVVLESHPEIAVEGALTKAQLREELARLRSIGITPIPKNNFSCAHNGWMKQYATMVGTPAYEQFCRDVIEETIDIFDKPEFFHVGLEEETIDDQLEIGFPTCIVRSPDKLIEDANDLFNTCLKNGVRPWMWADPQVVKVFGGEKSFKNNVPKEVLISNWYYGLVSPDYHDSTALYSHSGRINVYNQLDEWGYEQMPTVSSYMDRANPEQTMRYCRETFKNPENLRGFITAPWVRPRKHGLYALKSDAWFFNCGKKKVFPEY